MYSPISVALVVSVVAVAGCSPKEGTVSEGTPGDTMVTESGSTAGNGGSAESSGSVTGGASAMGGATETGQVGIIPIAAYVFFSYIGFDTATFTPLFAAARITGWCAHVMEQLASNSLIRPLSAYSGVDERHLETGDVAPQ